MRRGVDRVRSRRVFLKASVGAVLAALGGRPLRPPAEELAKSPATDVKIEGLVKPGFEPVRDLLAASFASGDNLGASAAIFVDGEPVLDIWGGHLDVARTRPWAKDTVVNTFSTTKTMSALAAMILVDRREIDLDAPVAKYWPEFGAAGKAGVKIRHLLSHIRRTGMDRTRHGGGRTRSGQGRGPARPPVAMVGAGHGDWLPVDHDGTAHRPGGAPRDGHDIGQVLCRGGSPLSDEITREAYSHEVSSAGFWPGGGGVEFLAFYSYAYAAPAGFSDAHIEPAEAYFDKRLGEFVLPYDIVRRSRRPEAVLMAFLQSTYNAAADLGGWDRAALECPTGAPRKPRPLFVAAGDPEA